MMKDHLHIVLTLDEIIACPEKVETLPSQEVMNMLLRITAIQPLLIGRLAFLGSEKKEAKSQDRLLTVKEASKVLGYSKDWIYRHADKLPFTKRLTPHTLRFSEAGIEKYIKNRPS